MASDAGLNVMDFDVWPDNYQSGMYPEYDFITSTAPDPYTDFSVLANEIVDEYHQGSESESEEDEDSTLGSSTIDAAAWFGDKELIQGHTMAAELRPEERFNQKIPPVYDGAMSYFAYEKLVCEWCNYHSCSQS